jgi:hypothetical protein
MVPGRTYTQCRYRWVDNLDPDINTGRWTEEEDATLIEGVNKHGHQWVPVGALLPGRSNHQCLVLLAVGHMYRLPVNQIPNHDRHTGCKSCRYN